MCDYFAMAASGAHSVHATRAASPQGARSRRGGKQGHMCLLGQVGRDKCARTHARLPTDANAVPAALPPPGRPLGAAMAVSKATAASVVTQRALPGASVHDARCARWERGGGSVSAVCTWCAGSYVCVCAAPGLLRPRPAAVVAGWGQERMRRRPPPHAALCALCCRAPTQVHPCMPCVSVVPSCRYIHACLVRIVLLCPHAGTSRLCWTWHCRTRSS